MSHYFAPIVEGHGEIAALPILLRRIAADVTPPFTVEVNPPIRVKSGSFLNDPIYFSRYVNLAAAKASMHQGSVLILLDSEDDCPAKLGPELLARAQQVRPDVPCLVILAYREFETWFLASASSLCCRNGLPEHLSPPFNPEGIRDAKGWLSDRMTGGLSYDPVSHQAAFPAALDMQEARCNPSFNRLWLKLARYSQDT